MSLFKCWNDQLLRCHCFHKVLIIIHKQCWYFYSIIYILQAQKGRNFSSLPQGQLQDTFPMKNILKSFKTHKIFLLTHLIHKQCLYFYSIIYILQALTGHSIAARHRPNCLFNCIFPPGYFVFKNENVNNVRFNVTMCYLPLVKIVGFKY
jgi:hypothetical protein